MKKLLLPLFAFLAFAKPAKSQFPYASIWSDFSPTYSLTSGFATSVTPGFLWCGYQPALAPGGFPWWPNNMNFFIRGTGASSIWPAYKLYHGTGSVCTGGFTQILNGVGVSAIEVIPGTFANNALRYAVAGAYDKGCYFVGLNSSGACIASKLFPFPPSSGQSSPDPSRPLLCQLPGSSDFFIVGSYEGNLYVIRIDNTGNIVWSSFYKVDGFVMPKDIIVSPYTNKELLIVGKSVSHATSQDGFLLNIDVDSGLSNASMVFDGHSGKDEFNTIIAASAGIPGHLAGYVIGGSTEISANNTEAWLIKLDVNANILWSVIPQPSSGANLGFVDIIERLNSNSKIEFYGVLRSAAGMVVLKLDEWGYPFLFSADALHNEFIYNLPATIPSVPASISQVQGPSNSTDVGIQVYGTASNITSARTSHFVSAYFNGESNCFKTLQSQHQPLQSRVEQMDYVISNYGGLEACTIFSVQVVYPGGAMNYPCSGLIAFGNNLRTIPTDISNTEQLEGTDFAVFPNPVKDKATVKFLLQENQNTSIELKNTLGQVLKTIDFKATSSDFFTQEIDFNALDLVNGVYFVSANINGSIHTQKIVYNK